MVFPVFVSECVAATTCNKALYHLLRLTSGMGFVHKWITVVLSSKVGLKCFEVLLITTGLGLVEFSCACGIVLNRRG